MLLYSETHLQWVEVHDNVYDLLLDDVKNELKMNRANYIFRTAKNIMKIITFLLQEAKYYKDVKTFQRYWKS